MSKTLGPNASDLMSNAPIPPAAAAVLRDTVGVALSSNPHLTREFSLQWLTSKKVCAAVAENLCSREYDLDMIKVILGREKRAGALFSLLGSNRNTSGVLSAFASLGANKTVLGSLLDEEGFDPCELVDRFDQLAPFDRLRLLVLLPPDVLGDSDLAAYLKGSGAWDWGSARRSRRHHLATALTHFRDGFVRELVALGPVPEYLQAAVGASPWLAGDTAAAFVASDPNHYALMAQAANPWTPDGLLDKLAGAHPQVAPIVHTRIQRGLGAFTAPPWELNAEQLNVACIRIRGSQYKPAGRPQLGALLARHPGLEAFQLDGVVNATSLCSGESIDAPMWAIEETLAALEVNFPGTKVHLQPKGAGCVSELDSVHRREPLDQEALDHVFAMTLRQLTIVNRRLITLPKTSLVEVLDRFSDLVGDSPEAWVFVANFADSLECTLEEFARMAHSMGET